MAVDTFRETALDQAPWLQLQPLLDGAATHGTPGEFERVLAASHRRQQLGMATDG